MFILIIFLYETNDNDAQCSAIEKKLGFHYCNDIEL